MACSSCRYPGVRDPGVATAAPSMRWQVARSLRICVKEGTLRLASRAGWRVGQAGEPGPDDAACLASTQTETSNGNQSAAASRSPRAALPDCIQNHVGEKQE